jgi:hypothetical protein
MQAPCVGCIDSSSWHDKQFVGCAVATVHRLVLQAMGNANSTSLQEGDKTSQRAELIMAEELLPCWSSFTHLHAGLAWTCPP